jgi:ferric-dicitrate binding protein FerR (iron transport regulator)
MDYKNLIDPLMTKFLQGKLTFAERKQLYDLLVDDANEQIFKEFLLSHISEFTGELPYYNKAVDFDCIYENILTTIDREVPEKKSAYKKILIFVSSAAAIFICAFLLGRFWSGDMDKTVKQAISQTYTELKAPYGSRSEVKLPDGTIVKLNAGSTLKYGSNYNLENRDISMTGEAYFKVAKNAEMPLIVNAGTISVKAIGTEFNIKAYEDEGTIEATLIEGKVEISSDAAEMKKPIDLVPNQKAIFFKGEESYLLEDVNNKPVQPQPVRATLDKILISPNTDIQQIVAWTEGKMILRGESLEDLCAVLERKYDVKFVYWNEEIKRCKFTGVLLDETLEQVLSVIKMTAPIEFTLEGKTVFLASDAKKLEDFLKHMK